MIESMNLTMAIIDAFRKSKASFCLTGSQYFGNPGQFSDWDFFVEESTETIKFLRYLGFSYLNSGSYVDETIVTVMRHSAGIDVQLVSDYAIKKKAQEWIMDGIMKGDIDRTRFTHRELRSQVWEQAIFEAKQNIAC